MITRLSSGFPKEFSSPQIYFAKGLDKGVNKCYCIYMKPKRSLYQCLLAHVRGDRIVCVKGHYLGGTDDGSINILRLERGAPLEFTICQTCRDYDRNGAPIPENERGWRSKFS